MTWTGDRIRHWRKRAGISQAALGSLVGRSGNQIGKYERNECKPAIGTLEAIARALDVTVPHLTEDEPTDLVLAEPMADPYGLHSVDPFLCLLPFIRDWDGTWPVSPREKRWYVSREYLHHQECLITTMKDDSMHPFLMEGDAMIVDPAVRRPRSLAVVIVRIDGELLVRRFKRDGQRRLFAAANTRYVGIISTGREEVVGQVLGVAARKIHDSTQFELGKKWPE